MNAQWEMMTLRAAVASESEAARLAAGQLLDLKADVEAAQSDRQHLRQIVAALESDLQRERQSHLEELNATRDQLKKTSTDLRKYQRQMNHLKETISRTFMVSFGRSKRKLKQLATVD